VRGEILMGGVGLAEGYVNDSKKTADAFVDGVRARLQLPPFNLFGLGEETRMYRTGDYGRWLPNGDLEYLGRIDCQVKINGLRIELGEIENAIKSVGDSVKDAAVVAAGNILVAFSSGNANIRDLQEACRKKLPEYMVPKLYLTIEGEDGWPRTSSLKVDRKELVKRADEHIKNGPSKDTSIACSGSEAADGAGLDSLGMVRATMKIEAEEERLITNMKAVASFLIHAAHFFQQISKDFDGTDDT
jgi:acyl-CoA synthetase (AMP-forming)/AMP-acid ligase II